MKIADNLPEISRVVPSEGPIAGGIEVTVLGSDFYGIKIPRMPEHSSHQSNTFQMDSSSALAETTLGLQCAGHPLPWSVYFHQRPRLVSSLSPCGARMNDREHLMLPRAGKRSWPPWPRLTRQSRARLPPLLCSDTRMVRMVFFFFPSTAQS